VVEHSLVDAGPARDARHAGAREALGGEFLERGGILFFPVSPFKRTPADQSFLLNQKQEDADYRKNIAYRPKEDKVTGAKGLNAGDSEKLCRIMRDYSQQAQNLVRTVLTPYSRNWKVDFASFRPIEEKGRKMRLRARNDLLHVDSFPTRPIYGDRIFRVFENLNPSQNRVWQTSETFDKLAQTFKSRMPAPAKSKFAELESFAPYRAFAKACGFRLNGNSPYDRWMLDFHNFLKENGDFQEYCRKDRWELPPGSAWIVFTDVVSHSVLSGQYALEQTFIISQKDLVLPAMAPINVLKRMYAVSDI